MPGIVIVWSAGRPQLRVIEVPLGQPFRFGRAEVQADDHTSTQHAEVYARSEDFLITDLQSRNGTYFEGERVPEQFPRQVVVPERAIVRTGRTLWFPIHDTSEHTPPPDDALALERIPWIVDDTVQAIAPQLPIHARVIEQYLLAAWPDRDALVADVRAAVRRCSEQLAEQLCVEHLRALVPRTPTVRFAAYFEHLFDAPPPFWIPEPYHAHTVRRIRYVPTEIMIGSPGGPVVVVEAQLGQVATGGPGWWQAGFWGHGVNSYAMYYGRATERTTLFLRLPYGGGAYCSDPEGERAEALRKLQRYPALVGSLPVKRAMVIESMGRAIYEIERLDGRVVRSNPDDYRSLDTIDLLALTARYD